MLLALFSLVWSPFAQAESITAGASATATARVGTHGCVDQPSECEWLSFRDAATFSPWVKSEPNTNVAAKGALTFRVHGDGTGHADPMAAETAEWSLRVTDAWVSTRTPNANFTLGIQRIAWGVAQGYSLVDTVNPLDLENPTRFDQRLSSLASDLTLHSETFAASVIVVPFFVPAALPANDSSLTLSAQDLLDERFTGSRTLQIGDLETRPMIPSDVLGETSVATRVRFSPQAGDFALSWHHGRDSLPQVAGDVVLVGFQTKQDAVDVGVPLVFPKRHVLGFTARGGLPGSLTGWAETVVILPENTAAAPTEAQLAGLVNLGVLDAIPDPIPQTVTQDGEPVWKWLLGLDRGVGSVQLTAQWLHGFVTERQQADLSDYALFSAQWAALPTVRLDALGATDFKGHLVNFGVTALHADTAEITVGASIIDGPDDSALAAIKTASNLHTTVTMRF